MEDKHRHDWKEDGKYLRCQCGKKKLKLQFTDDKISFGERKNNTHYTVRQNRERIFLPQEWKNFYDNLKLNQKFTFKFLLLTGARIMEASNVKVEDIDFANQRLILRITKRVKKDVSFKPHTRTLRISSELCKDIKKRINEKQLSSSDYLGLLTTSAANLALKKTLSKINIKDWQMFSIHNIRKTSETWALALGIDSMILSKRFGHNLSIMYQHYSQADAYTYKEKDAIKEIFGDTFIVA